MKSRVALLCLGLVTAGFCVDEYLPIAPQTLEIDVGVSPTFYTNSTVTGLPVLQVKYGVMAGLDIEVAANYTIGDVAGLTQPEIAAKYAIGSTGLGVYANVVLPFATGDNDVPNVGLGIAPGVVYGKNFDKIQAVAKASYQINLEGDDVKKGDVLDIYLKPGYTVNEKLGAYVGVDYKMYGESEAAGTAVAGSDGTGFYIAPGITYMHSSALSFEANIPIVLSDDINGESWGIWASVYYTMPL